MHACVFSGAMQKRMNIICIAISTGGTLSKRSIFSRLIIMYTFVSCSTYMYNSVFVYSV